MSKSAQASLFEWNAANAEQLERVGGKIAGAVLDFCRRHYRYAGTTPSICQFHLEELASSVRSATGIAPDSPGRILRMLRQAGQIRYRVLNRRQSLYRVDWVKP